MHFREITSKRLAGTPACLRFCSKWGKTVLAVGSFDGEVSFLDASNLSPVFSIDSGLHTVMTMDAAESGQELVVGGEGGLAALDLERSTAQNLTPGLSDYVYICKITADGNRVFYAGSEEYLRCLVRSSGLISTLSPSGESTSSISLQIDQEHLVFAAVSDSGNCDIVLLSLLDGSCTHRMDLQFQNARVAFTPCGRNYVVIDHYVRFFDYPNHLPRWIYSEQNGFVEQAETHNWDVPCTWTRPVFSPDSTLLFCGGPSGAIYAFDLRQGSLVACVAGTGEKLKDLDVHWNSGVMATVSDAGMGDVGTLTLWAIQDENAT